MSVGHVQREFERSGIPTVGVYVESFAYVPELMGVSRALITKNPMGRPLGRPHDAERQMSVVRQAVDLLNSGERTIEKL